MKEIAINLIKDVINILFIISYILTFSCQYVNAETINVITVEASSQYPSDGSSYYPKYAVDGRRTTAWFPAQNKNENSWIKFNFGKEVSIKQINIINGWIKNNMLWHANSRIKNAIIELSDGTKNTISLKDVKSVQHINLQKNKTKWIKIIICEIYRGSTWNVPGITEVSFQGYVTNTHSSTITNKPDNISNHHEKINQGVSLEYFRNKEKQLSAKNNVANQLLNNKRLRPLESNRKNSAPKASKTIHQCAASFDIECLKVKYEDGEDINKKSKTGITPLFDAITSIRNNKHETHDAILTVKWLLEHGADTKYEVNPYPPAFKKDMTAKEYLLVNSISPLFNFRAPKAPMTLSLFSNKKIMDSNFNELEYAKRAKLIGISRKDYMKRLHNVELYRKSKTFAGYSNAFKITGEKKDFIHAQKLAKSQDQQKKLEYLALLAVKNKFNIFKVSTHFEELSSSKLEDNNQSTKVFHFLRINGKSSKSNYKASSTVKVRTDSPIKLTNSYKLTVRYTLSAVLKTTTTVHFILTRSETKTENIHKIIEEVFTLKPKVYSDTKKLNFGSISIASSTRMFGGIGETKTILDDDPILSTEIIALECIDE